MFHSPKDRIRFSKLNSLIGSSQSGWHEYNLEVVAEELDNLDPQCWEKLFDFISSKDTYWRSRCTAALGECKNTRCLELLSKILITDVDKEIKLTCISTLEDEDYILDKEYKSCLNTLLDDMNKNIDFMYYDVKRLLDKIK